MSEDAGNPVATSSQHEQELAALELTTHPTVKAAYRSVAETWLLPALGVRPDGMIASMPSAPPPITSSPV